MTEQETNRYSAEDITEDEYDMEVFNQAYKEYIDSRKESHPIEELWKELDIYDD